MRYRLIGQWLVTALLATACSTSKPCAEGGDVSWYPPIVGNKKCTQKENSEGKTINEGPFLMWDQKDHILLEGNFKGGRKDGIWTQYNDRGEKIMEKNFQDGVETSMPIKAN